MMKSLVPVALITGWLAVQGATAPVGQPEALPAASAAAVPGAAPDAYVSSLRAELEEIIRRPRWEGDRWSVLVISLDRGDTLFAYGARDTLAPASNMKLFTTAAALYYLGPDFRYNTFLMTTGPVRDGVVEGDLIVYGTGDPTFSDRFGNKLAVFEAFADTLQALGIREIRGDIVGDGSYFSGSGAGEGWQQSYMNASYAATASALSFAENVAMLQIGPAEQVGWRPNVKLIPGGEGVAIVNQATTVASGNTRVTALRVAYDGPVVVSGQVGRRAAPVLRAVPVSDPARYAAAAFREVLAKRGLTVTGGTRAAMTEQESPVTGRFVFAPALDSSEPVHVLAVHTSMPLQRILEIINKRSHNLMAEQVLRTVGRVAVGDGSVAGGRRAVQHMLEREGYTAETKLYDGSGLSVLNRASAAGIVDLLALMAKSHMWEAYWETLPEAGASDGLRRMYRTGAERNLRAKTGTIDNVSALSGYVRAANGERLAFSILSNNVPSTWMAKRVEDAIGARIADFHRPAGVTESEAAPSSTIDSATPPASTTPAAPAGATAPPRTAPPTAQSRATEPPATTAAARTHTIRQGDTLGAIARRYGTTVDALQKANPGLNPRRLKLGNTIKIPQ